MAWTTPRTWVAGDFTDAAMLNAHFRDNMSATEAGVVTTAGDILYASGSHALTRLAAGTSGQMLQGGTPAWANVPAMLGGTTGNFKTVRLTGINATPQTLVTPSGVTMIDLSYVIIPSTGTVSAGESILPDTLSAALYNDGTNIVTLSFSTPNWVVTRTGGTRTYTLVAFVMYRG